MKIIKLKEATSDLVINKTAGKIILLKNDNWQILKTEQKNTDIWDPDNRAEVGYFSSEERQKMLIDLIQPIDYTID